MDFVPLFLPIEAEAPHGYFSGVLWTPKRLERWQ
jgi:hypothetical protein